MAKKGRKKGRRRGGSRRGSKTPKTFKGVWKRQPLLVKAGLGLTGLEIASNSLNLAIAQLQAKQYGSASATISNAATNLNNYKPLAYGVVGHYIAKTLGVKGL